MKLFKRIAALGLAVLLSLSLTACSDTSWVYKTDDNTVSSGVYLGYLTTAYLNGQSEADFNKELSNIWKQQIGGVSYKDYCIAEAEEASKRHLAIAAKFDEMGLEFDEEDISSLDYQVEVYWAYYYQQYLEPNGTSKESYRKIAESSLKESAIFEAYYGKDGIEEVPQEDIIDIMLDEYVDVNYFEISFADEEGAVLPAAEKDELLAKAEDYVNRINEGKNTFNEVKTEYEDGVAKAAAEENGTEFTATSPEDIEDDKDTKSLLHKNATTPNADFVKSAFEDVKVGKATVLTIGTSYFVVVKYDINDDLENNLDSCRNSVLNTLKGDVFMKLINEWTDAVTMTENTSALHKYSPKNIEEPKA